MKTSILKVDGKEYALAYDFNAIADAEQSAGCNLLAALETLSNISAVQLRGLLYAAIVPEPKEPRLTLLEAGMLIRVDTIAPITKALADAYMLSMPAAPVEDAPAPAAATIPKERVKNNA